MNRILYILTTILLLASGCKPEDLSGKLSVSPAVLEFGGNEGTQTLSVTATGTWALKQTAGTQWCTPSKTYGKTSTTVDIHVSANGPSARSTEFVFSLSGADDVKVTVNQAAGNAEIPVEKGEFYPDPSSGIEIDPVCPDADKPCTIIFKPSSDNPLYGHSGDLYAHLGIVVDGEWMYVPCEWGTTDAKCRFTKAGDAWKLELKPTLREFFGSGETPVNKLAVIVRSADGNIKSHDADQFCSVTDTKYKAEVFEPDPLVTKKMPSDVRHGINYNPDGTVTFVLYDRDTAGKSHKYCYIVGDWNNWERKTEGAMYWDGSKYCWWITLGDFDPSEEYRFQYRLGNTSGSDTYISDPYTEIVYDQWNDQYIPGVPAFPEGAKGHVSAFRINRDEYAWQIPDYKVEDRNDLVIYEMLLRDFTKSQNIAGALEQLDYIDQLGVNAIELMPIQEFDGNLSWGYNPNHYFALDKYYGTREQYKQFVDECHKRGLAVIVDVVYNHTYGSHPWAKMWWNSAANCTADNNPFYNAVAKHPFNVGHDFNHENEIVKEHVKRSLQYLLEEYNVDGFRFDLTKGFTQKDTGAETNEANVSAWSKYDQSRVDILKDYADHVWSVNPDAVVIFEHLSEDKEEKVLAEHGIKLWRNVNHEYRSAVTGNAGDFTRMSSTAPFGGFVGYMESHDEERLCYGAAAGGSWGICGTMNNWSSDITMTKDGLFVVARNVSFTANDEFKLRLGGDWGTNYGTSTAGYKLPAGKGHVLTSNSQNMKAPAAGKYDVYFCPEIATIWMMTPGQRPADPQVEVSDENLLTVSLRRAGASAAFFLMVPGPKMIWQFGEIGYDYSINYNDRTGEKPVVTAEYMAVPERKALYDTYAKLLKFRSENPRFFDSDASFSWTPTASTKTITCSVDGKKFHVVGNFSKATVEYAVPSGTWNDYINGGSVSGKISLRQGEFRLLTDF